MSATPIRSRPPSDPSGILPAPVLRRLPKYLTRVQDLRRAGDDWASSITIAQALRLTPSTVRQDFAHLALRGTAKRGYCTAALETVLRQVLVANRPVRVVVVGAGHLGVALGAHGELNERGFEICGIFDAAARQIGRRVGAHTVQSIDALRRTVRRKRVTLGVVAVPAKAAQGVANMLVAAGVGGLLNLAYVHLSVPPDVVVVDARLLDSLQQLAYLTRTHESARSKDQPGAG